MSPKKRPPFRLRLRYQERRTAASTPGPQKFMNKNQHRHNDLDDASLHQNYLNNSRTKNWRDKIKSTDPHKYERIKEAAREYSQEYRLKISLAESTLKKRNLTAKERENAEMWLRRKECYNKKSNLRQKKYTTKKKLEKEQNKNKPTIPLTRQKADKKREYERNKKRAQRASYSAEKHEAIKARRRELYAQKKERLNNSIHGEKEKQLKKQEQRLKEIEERLKAQEQELQRRQDKITSKTMELEQREEDLTEKSPSKGVDMRSDAARRQSPHRAKSSMPRKTSHFVGTVVDMIDKASPSTSSAFKGAGVGIKQVKRKLTLEEAVTSGVAQGLKTNVPKERKLLGKTLSILKKYKLQRKACKRFNISKKNLRSNKKAQGRKPLDYKTFQTVQEFYNTNSVQIPDKKLVSKKTGKPLHVLDRPIFSTTYQNLGEIRQTITR